MPRGVSGGWPVKSMVTMELSFDLGRSIGEKDDEEETWKEGQLEAARRLPSVGFLQAGENNGEHERK
jgi:hypothetical protein